MWLLLTRKQEADQDKAAQPRYFLRAVALLLIGRKLKVSEKKRTMSSYQMIYILKQLKVRKVMMINMRLSSLKMTSLTRVKAVRLLRVPTRRKENKMSLKINNFKMRTLPVLQTQSLSSLLERKLVPKKAKTLRR